jgi:hypothetical protein
VAFGKDLAERTNSERVDWNTWQLPPRAGAILSYASKVAGTATHSHWVCLPFDPNTVWVLTYSGSVYGEDDENQLQADFKQLIGTLRVHYTPEAAEKLAPALERGQALLATLRKQAERVQLDENEHYYEITIGGKPIGYFRRRVSTEEYVFSRSDARNRSTKKGVRVRERSWRFADDGTVRYTRLDLFSSFDLRSEVIENQQIQVPAPDFQPQELLIKTDRVLREDEVAFSSFTTNRDRGLPDPRKPITVGPVYLDLAWVRLLPGLLLSTSQEPHAFVIYDFDTRGLLSHAVQPLGEKNLADVADPVYGFEVREGFIEQPSLVYTDRRGFLVRLEAGSLAFTRVTREQIEQKYGQRRDEARERFKLKDD